MKRLLLPLLTCSLLAACGAGTASVPTDNGSGGTGGGGTGGGTGSTPASCVSGISAGSLGAQSLGVQPLSITDAGRPDWSAPHVAGEVLIVGGQAAAVQSLGLQAAAVDSLGLIRASTPAGQTDQAYAETLRARGLQVQPNYIYKALATPNDPGFPGGTRAGVTVNGAAYDQDYLTRINALAGWNLIGGAPQGAKVAVLDTGVDFSHPDLKGRLLPGCDFGDNDDDASEVTSGDVGHGTSSTGLIGAATNNGTGIAGLTWTGQNILPVKVFSGDGATTTALAQGIRYAAAQGAKVINMSLGFVGSSDPTVASAIQAAAAKDVLMVAAAGNTPGDGLYYPASDNSVMAVGAIGGTDPKAANYNDLACYSARPKAGQKGLDLVAPGGNAGTGTSNCYTGSSYDILTLQPGGYTLRAGTSEAAPQVSGAAALIRAYRPNLTANQVRAILTSTAKTVSGGKLLDVGAAVAQAGRQ